jgi:hypothetical protein
VSHAPLAVVAAPPAPGQSMQAVFALRWTLFNGRHAYIHLIMGFQYDCQCNSTRAAQHYRYIQERCDAVVRCLGALLPARLGCRARPALAQRFAVLGPERCIPSTAGHSVIVMLGWCLLLMIQDGCQGTP